MPKKLKSALEAIEYLRKLDRRKYDGIHGILPKWVPPLFVTKFKKIQSKLLIGYRYTPNQIRKYLRYYAGKEIGADRTPNRILDHIAFFWLLKYAVEVGEQDEQEGLSILLGGKTAADIISGQNYRNAQSEKAKKTRGKIGHNETTIKQIIHELALSCEHKEDSNKELWRHFYWKLKDEGLDPEEKPHASDLNKICYLYNFNDNRKSISFGRFVNVITKSPNK